MPILIHCQVDGAEATTPNLLLNDILVYPVHGGAIVVAAAIVGAGIECFFDSTAARRRSAVVSNGALVSGRRQVFDHLRAAGVGGGRKVDMNSVAGQDTSIFHLRRRGRLRARRALSRRTSSHDVACAEAEAALGERAGSARVLYTRGSSRGGARPEAEREPEPSHSCKSQPYGRSRGKGRNCGRKGS